MQQHDFRGLACKNYACLEAPELQPKAGCRGITCGLERGFLAWACSATNLTSRVLTQVSHWGNVAVEERYELRHVGATQKVCALHASLCSVCWQLRTSGLTLHKRMACCTHALLQQLSIAHATGLSAKLVLSSVAARQYIIAFTS